MEFRWKLMNQTGENGKKPNFGPNFGLFGPNLGPKFFFVCSNSTTLLDVRHCRKLSSYAISRKTSDPNSRKWQKNLILDLIRLFGPRFGPPIFFSKILLRQLWDIIVSYHHEHYQKKLMIQSWESFVMDGRTDSLTDRKIERRTRVIS